MKNLYAYLLAFIFLFIGGAIMAQRIPKPKPKPKPEPSMSLKRQYDDALRKSSDVSYKHSMKPTVVQQTSRNVEIAKTLKPTPRSYRSPVNNVSIPTRNQNINQANTRAKRSAQNTVNRWNYNRAKQELKANPMKSNRKIAGEGTKNEFRNAQNVANKTGTNPQNLTKVSSSKQGSMEAHGVVDNKSKKLVEVKPKNVYPQNKAATQSRIQKKEAQFNNNANSLTKPQQKVNPPKPDKRKPSKPQVKTNPPKPKNKPPKKK
ncbi:MAG: hypothetical protein ABJF04_11825 [Reichenbachiella sp.]|uniref:hypothetical protein n=1 Tax=Reichenbachiella sp. TaxID=2184521 RepID=UPI0032650C18